MANYRDPVRMVRDIRTHVHGEGHRVQPADDPMRQMLGYTCPICESFWTCGLLALRELDQSRLMGIPLTGVVQRRDVRDRLTAYLNWELDDPAPVSTPPLVVRVSRYKRPPVI